MQILKETDQILTEELFEELRLSGWRFIKATKDIDSYRATLDLRNSQNESVVLKIQLDGPDCSLNGHKNRIRQALINYDPSILEDLVLAGLN